MGDLGGSPVLLPTDRSLLRLAMARDYLAFGDIEDKLEVLKSHGIDIRASGHASSSR